MLSRVLPRQIDNTYRGHWLALALFGLFLALKLTMSLNSILNTRAVATGADGIPLDAYGGGGEQAVLTLFALLALGQLTLAVIGVIALIRYRAMIPFLLVVLLAEHLGRRALLALNPITRPDGPPVGLYINIGLAAVLLLALVLSVVGRRYRETQ